jgi:hypothetical protein
VSKQQFITFVFQNFQVMVSNDFKEEKDTFLTQAFDESVSGFGIFWVCLALVTIFAVVVGIIA